MGATTSQDRACRANPYDACPLGTVVKEHGPSDTIGTGTQQLLSKFPYTSRICVGGINSYWEQTGSDFWFGTWECKNSALLPVVADKN